MNDVEQSVDGSCFARSNGLSVLVVDDDPEIVDVLHEFLSGEGYSVAAFTDPLLALGAVARAAVDPDAVLVDQVMPGVGGREFASRLRGMGVLCPVMLVTGDRRAVCAGEPRFASVIYKPFDVDRLLAAVRAVLPRSAAA